jgi:hypothetical protein
MKRFGTFLAGIIIVTTGCTSNLLADPTNTPTLTSTTDAAATSSAISAEETQFALETQDFLSQILTGTAEAFKTIYASTSQYLTANPKPTKTPTLTATATSASGGGSAGFTDCKDATGGRTKVRVENNTGGIAYLSMFGPETYYCAIPGGVVQIFIKGGVYSVSANMCGQVYNFGSHVINSTWKLILRC